ncbi:MAG: DUF1365 domain-containing protein [Hyphomicrobiales bacterium]|nr:DUF1365 domain-containing protein [Hyphomicrobiales bacterium]
MAAMNGAIAFCDSDIFHARLGARPLRFRYAMVSILVDLDQLREADAVNPLFSVGRFNLLGFDERDHGLCDGSSLRAYIDTLHAQNGLAAPSRIILACFPRILGYVFNPLSVYVGFDRADRPTSVLYEVRNTFGERHSYFETLVTNSNGAPAAHEADKIFYVSPFMDMALRYRFLLTPPHEGGFALKIIEKGRAGVELTALLVARPFAPNISAIVGRIARTPLLGFKALAAIHRQALALMLRGHRIRPRPRPPAPVSINQPGLYSRLSATSEDL